MDENDGIYHISCWDAVNVQHVFALVERRRIVRPASAMKQLLSPFVATIFCIEDILSVVPSLVHGNMHTLANFGKERENCFACQHEAEKRRILKILEDSRLGPRESPSAEMISEMFPGKPKALEYFQECFGTAAVVEAFRYFQP
eukprot:3128718-Rhodomonas_salina.4